MIRSTRIRLAAAIAAVTLVAACGSDDSSDTTTAAPAGAATTVAADPATTAAPDDPYGGTAETSAPVTTVAAAGDGVSIEVAATSLGDVLTSDGLTLYIFTPDAGGTPTCVDACAGAWPPLEGDAANPGEGVSAADVTTVERPDGTTQLAYHGWPLYFYAADRAPGDVTGQGVGGNWFVIGPDGEPIGA